MYTTSWLCSYGWRLLTNLMQMFYPGNLANETDPTGCYVDADNDGYGDSNPSDSNIDAGTDCDDTDVTI